MRILKNRWIERIGRFRPIVRFLWVSLARGTKKRTAAGILLFGRRRRHVHGISQHRRTYGAMPRTAKLFFSGRLQRPLIHR
jgi:hypothetical protein